MSKSSSPQLVILDVKVRMETERSIHASTDGDQFVWLPLSQVQTIWRFRGEIIRIKIPAWLARKKGLA